MSILTIKPLGGGINKDLAPSELGPTVWSDALNVRFRNGFAEKRRGISQAMSAPSVTPYAIATYDTPATRFIVYAGLAHVYVYDGTTTTDITPVSTFTGAASDRWSICTLNGILVMCNGKNEPVYWGGNVANKLAILPNWTAGDTCDAISSFKDYLIALAPTLSGVKYPHNVMWSTSAAPGSMPTTWTASSTNDAGDTPEAAETGGVIVDGRPLGNLFIIYKQDARFALQFIGGNDIFALIRLPGSEGLLARGCIADTQTGHVFLSPNDVLVHEGAAARSIANGRVREWLFNSLDSSRIYSAFAVSNPALKEAMFAFPTVGSTGCDYALVWNWVDDTHSIFGLPDALCAANGLLIGAVSSSLTTYDATTTTYDATTVAYADAQYSTNAIRVLIGTAAPQVGIMESDGTDFGADIAWTLEKTGISWTLDRAGAQVDDSDSMKVLSRIRPQVIAASGVQVTAQVAATKGPNDVPAYSSPATYTVGTDNWLPRFTQAGRYLAVKLTGSRPEQWSLRSIDVDVTKVGQF